jgi:hypothetical protein
MNAVGVAALRAREDSLVETVKKVETLVTRLRIRSTRHSTTQSSICPHLSLVEKARMLKSRASRIAKRVQVSDKSDDTASTSESVTGAGEVSDSPLPTKGGSGVTWSEDTVQVSDKLDETASTLESLNRSGEVSHSLPFKDGSGVNWFKDSGDFDTFGEI